MEKNCFDVALKKLTKINKRSPSNKTVALRKKVRINNRRGYYYSIGKSTYLGTCNLFHLLIENLLLAPSWEKGD